MHCYREVWRWRLLGKMRKDRKCFVEDDARTSCPPSSRRALSVECHHQNITGHMSTHNCPFTHQPLAHSPTNTRTHTLKHIHTGDEEKEPVVTEQIPIASEEQRSQTLQIRGFHPFVCKERERESEIESRALKHRCAASKA
jgi:hypothetical protein